MPNYVRANPIKLVFAAFAALALNACATTSKPVDIQVTESSGADFSTQRTFFMLPEPPDENGRRPARTFARQAVDNAVRSQMLARNYEEVNDHEAADLFVAIQFSLKDDQRLRNVVDYDYSPSIYSSYGGYRGYGRSSRYGGGYSGYGHRSYYGYTPIARTSVRVENFRQGNMVVDIVDRAENSVLWEGYASGEGEFSVERIEARVNMVVGRMFAQFAHYAPVQPAE